MLLKEVEIEDLEVGKTRVKSLVTGSIGVISRILSEEKNEDRFDSVWINWENGEKSWPFLMRCKSVEILEEDE
jgi:hypothetical protein